MVPIHKIVRIRLKNMQKRPLLLTKITPPPFLFQCKLVAKAITCTKVSIMSIHISPNKRISDIQNAFNAAYPHLKLQFFSKAHGENKGSFAKFMIHDRNTTLAMLNPELREGTVSIVPETKTWALEQTFETEFQLHVQVFRQSGSIWLETSVSDQLTLAEQETKGARSLLSFEDPTIAEEPSDYRDQE